MLAYELCAVPESISLARTPLFGGIPVTFCSPQITKF